LQQANYLKQVRLYARVTDAEGVKSFGVMALGPMVSFGRPEGQLTQDMSAYRVWWVLTQWQILFNRLPWLEELLRLVPGLY
jgi:hypothetical protein